MDPEQKAFLSFLAYLYVKFLKFDRALLLLRLLLQHDSNNVRLLLLSSYAHWSTQNYRASLKDAQLAGEQAQVPHEQATAALLQSKALWRLESRDEARQALSRFLELQSSFVQWAQSSLNESLQPVSL